MLQEKITNNNSNKIWIIISAILFIFLLTFFLFKFGFTFLFHWFGFFTIIIWVWILFSFVIFVKKPTSLYVTITESAKHWGYLLYIFFCIVVFGLSFVLPVNYGVKSVGFNSDTNTMQKTKSNFDIEVTDFPEQVNCYYGESIVKMDVKNNTNEPFNFSDVSGGKYEFGICTGKGTCFPVKQSMSIVLEDFGVIPPGESKQLTLIVGDVGKNNIFGVTKDEKNQNYTYHIEISKVENKNKKPTVAMSNNFNVFSNVMEELDGVMVIKDCEQ